MFIGCSSYWWGSLSTVGYCARGRCPKTHIVQGPAVHSSQLWWALGIRGQRRNWVLHIGRCKTPYLWTKYLYFPSSTHLSTRSSQLFIKRESASFSAVCHISPEVLAGHPCHWLRNQPLGTQATGGLLVDYSLKSRFSVPEYLLSPRRMLASCKSCESSVGCLGAVTSLLRARSLLFSWCSC